MKAVTTFHPEGFERYGRRMIEMFQEYWPADVSLTVYAEDCVEDAQAVAGNRVTVLAPPWPELQTFRDVFAKRGRPKDWRFDAWRFAPKAWAIAEGLKDETGLCFWLDADLITTAPVTTDFLASLFPRKAYLAFVGRDGLQRPYTETGFVGFNGASRWHKPFLSYFLSLWTSGRLFDLPEWHDCYALDVTRKRFMLPENDLNTKREWDHPFASTILATCMDHLKGPVRKAAGTSDIREAA